MTSVTAIIILLLAIPRADLVLPLLGQLVVVALGLEVVALAVLVADVEKTNISFRRTRRSNLKWLSKCRQGNSLVVVAIHMAAVLHALSLVVVAVAEVVCLLHS